VKAAITEAIDTVGAIPGASNPPLGRSLSPRMRFAVPENGPATAVTVLVADPGADADPQGAEQRGDHEAAPTARLARRRRASPLRAE
jgi:hypothetical protein